MTDQNTQMRREVAEIPVAVERLLAEAMTSVKKEAEVLSVSIMEKILGRKVSP